jgi:hypothetical protein
MIKNTSYKVQVDVDSDATRNFYQIEEGAYVTTESGVWTVFNGAWVKLYPQAGPSTGLGWSRYDDSTYDEDNKLALSNGVEVVLPNDGGAVYRSHSGVDYYDSENGKILADNVNDVYLFTCVFEASASNANSTYLHLNLESTGATPYDRIKMDILFPKGNDVGHHNHHMFQYYADSSFVSSGSSLKITAIGGSANVWNIIYFIQKTQSYA